MSKSLMIDAGHGGADPGAGGFGAKEKDWTLKMSIYQYNRLKELGANVGITRTTDKTLDSGPRTRLIKGKYDYCMSNHLNAFNGSARGVETIHSIYSNGNVAKKIADAIVKTSGLPLRRVFSRKGKAGDYYYMHRLTGSTETIITEYGFIDNKNDNDYYKEDSNFKFVAESVVEVWCGILGVKYVAPGNANNPASKPPTPKPSKPQSKQRGVATVTVPTLNLRDKPSTSGKLIRKLSKGEAYKVWDEKNGWLRLGKDMWASWQNGVYMDWTEKPTKKKSKPKQKTLKVGQTVTLKKSATKFATGESIASHAKGKKYKIIQVKSDRVLLDSIMSWVKKSDVQ